VVLFEAGGVVFLALLALWLFALVDVITTPAAACRNLPKLLWIALVVLLPDLGSILWLLLGRPRRAVRARRGTDYTQPRPPIAIEDHPQYTTITNVTDRRSAELDKQIEEWEANQRELERRERGLDGE
jgi:phospholipase D-like protein